MPRLRKPRDLGSKHQAMIERLGDWLARKTNSTRKPLELARHHLGRHGFQRYECKLCGVAKAIVDCDGAVREVPAFNLVEAVQMARRDLDLGKRKLEEAVASFRSPHAEKAKQVSSTPDVYVAQEGQILAGAPVSAKEKDQDNLASILSRFPKVFATWDSLSRKLIRAEMSLGARIVSPSLAERKGRWPRDYIETKVYCYLLQHSWTPEDIVSILFPSTQAVASKVRSIKEQVRRAAESGRPPMLLGKPSQENE